MEAQRVVKGQSEWVMKEAKRKRMLFIRTRREGEQTQWVMGDRHMGCKEREDVTRWERRKADSGRWRPKTNGMQRERGC